MYIFFFQINISCQNSETEKFALTGMLPGFPAYPNHCLPLLTKKKQTFENEKKEGEKNTTGDFEEYCSKILYRYLKNQYVSTFSEIIDQRAIFSLSHSHVGATFATSMRLTSSP